MLDHAREAVDLAQGRSRDDLDSDRLLQLASTPAPAFDSGASLIATQH
jgi:hypothetical protein